MKKRLEIVPAAGAAKVDDTCQRQNAKRGAEPYEREHQPADSRIAVGRHWISLATFCLLSTALCLRCIAAPPPWSVQVSTNPAGPWITLTNVNWSAGFARWQGPAGAGISIGNVITISNATASTVLSNGVVVAQAAPLSSNDWLTLMSQPGISSNQYELILSHQ